MNSPVELGLDHRFIPGEGATASLTLLLLHGTGGDGDSLLQLGYTIAPGATLLSPTGKVSENGARRFFRRVAQGVFDQEDLALRTAELAAFVRDAVAAYSLDAAKVVAVGYSNGANIAASVLLRDPAVLAGAVLFRAMVPFEHEGVVGLDGTPVLVCSGARDMIMPPGEGDRLAKILSDAGATVTNHIEQAGHELTMGDIREATRWISEHFG